MDSEIEFFKKLSSKKCESDQQKIIQKGFAKGKTIADVIIEISDYQNKLRAKINEKTN